MPSLSLPAARKAAVLVSGLALLAALWTALASSIFLAGTGLWGRFGWSGRLSAWWLYRPYRAANPAVGHWLDLSAEGAAVLLLALGVALAVRFRAMPRVRALGIWGRQAVERGSSDNHGHADWMAMGALRRLFPGPDPAWGGVVVGEAYRVDQDSVAGIRFNPRDRRTWGRGGTAPLLIDPCRDGSTHSLIFAGSGGLKTVCAVSSLLHWTGSAVILDPSCELGPMLRRARLAMGHRVVMLDPAHAAECGVNVLDWIDPADPLAETHVQSVVGWAYHESKHQGGNQQNEFFVSMGRKLAACLLAHMLWDDELPPSEKTMARWRAGIAVPESQMKKDVLRHIHETSRSAYARQVAGTLMEMAADETFSGIYANANEATGWLSVRAYADLVSGSAFRTRDLCGGALTVFLQLPLDALMVTPEIARVLVGALTNAVYKADGAVNGRVLFLLDEAARLGHMTVLEQVRDAGRKYGISLSMLYQSPAQMEEIWGRPGKRAWYDGVSWRSYAAVSDMETAEEVSKAFGTFGAIAYSEGDHAGKSRALAKLEGGSRSTGSNTNRHEIKRRLIEPSEIIQDTRTDEQFIVLRGQPIRCGRAVYFRRPEMVRQVDANRFAKIAEKELANT